MSLFPCKSSATADIIDAVSLLTIIAFINRIDKLFTQHQGKPPLKYLCRLTFASLLELHKQLYYTLSTYTVVILVLLSLCQTLWCILQTTGNFGELLCILARLHIYVFVPGFFFFVQFSVFILSMPSKVIIVLLMINVLGYKHFWAFLRVILT